jgi:hypothetical protein
VSGARKRPRPAAGKSQSCFFGGSLFLLPSRGRDAFSHRKIAGKNPVLRGGGGVGGGGGAGEVEIRRSKTANDTVKLGGGHKAVGCFSSLGAVTAAAFSFSRLDLSGAA